MVIVQYRYLRSLRKLSAFKAKHSYAEIKNNEERRKTLEKLEAEKQRWNTWADYTATSVAMVGVSIPEFFLGVLLLLLFSVGLQGLFPSSGWIYLPGTCPTVVCTSSVWGNLQHVFLPAIALGTLQTAVLTRLLRST